MNPDRNLLYGLLVRLLDFAPRAEVCSALRAALDADERPLGEQLRASGQIDARQQAALDAIEREVLALHGGEAPRSLAELARSGGLAEELASMRRSLSGAPPEANATLPLPSGTLASQSSDAAISGEPESALGERFRILRTHAKGGLGEVFVAHDQELRREVALKQLHDRHADAPDNRARFLLEAEVTGGLEHPGIVPVYSLGRNAAGRPFYAMRFIRGDSLKEAIDRFHQADATERDPGERVLELRKLLRRFIDVCNAIEYAHSRGVIHRDLKPDNIMLGEFGETLVVDWGLAKPLGQAEGAAASPPFAIVADDDT
ncbi:MAG TPA: serine/threonine-protein kinase, partial [Pirellulales bacterium]|nr:serine/threonine-protein kinase [Pirellulales bacterium]